MHSKTKKITMKLTGKRLQVHHYAQIPCMPFRVDVKDEYEAFKISKTLADQHLFLLGQNIIPDYSNVIGVLMWDDDEQDWVDYYNDAEEMEWKEIESTYFATETA